MDEVLLWGILRVPTEHVVYVGMCIGGSIVMVLDGIISQLKKRR